jgi:hypothetical protein
VGTLLATLARKFSVDLCLGGIQQILDSIRSDLLPIVAIAVRLATLGSVESLAFVLPLMAPETTAL